MAYIDKINVKGNEYIIRDNGSTDRIVEQGQSGEWTYRKYESGIAECWLDLTNATNVTTEPYSNVHATAQFGDRDLPFTFADRPRFFLSVLASNLWGGLQGSNTGDDFKSHTPKIRLFSWSKQTNATGVWYSIYAIGKWK